MRALAGTTRLGRLRLVLILAALTMVGPFSIDTIFPAFDVMTRELGVDAVAMQQTLSVYLATFAVASLFHGSLSDAVGRKPVILVGCALYAVTSALCALAPSMPLLLGARAVQGLVAGAGMIVGRTVVRDLFDGAAAQRFMSHISVIFAVAPALAPIVGGWILGWGQWRTIFWVLTAYGVVLVVATLVALPETHPASARIPFRPRALVASIASVAGDASVLRLGAAVALNFAALFLYVSSAPAIVVDHLATGQQPRTFCCWLKTASKSSPELQALFSYGSNNTAGRFVVRLDNQPNVASDQPLKLELGGGSGQITGTTPLNDGLWHHVAVVVDDHDGSGNVNVSETKLWVDGHLDPVSSTDGREFATGATLVPCLGGSNHNDGYNFTGKLDDVRFFDRALSDAEVQALYASHPIYLTVPVDPTTGDDDGDGMSNEAEAIAGTDPDNASSVLRVAEFTVSGGTVSLKWMAFPGRDYQVEESTNLQSWLPVSGQGPVRIPPPATPGDPVVPALLSVSFPSSGPSSHYYRLKVTLSPP